MKIHNYKDILISFVSLYVNFSLIFFIIVFKNTSDQYLPKLSFITKNESKLYLFCAGILFHFALIDWVNLL